MRLDKYVQSAWPELSRAKIQKLIKEGLVSVNGKHVKASFDVKEDDKVLIPPVLDPEPRVKAEKIHLEIVEENENFIVLNKPSGMVVHPGEGGRYYSGTVVNALMDKVDEGVGEELRPGIVHRLDKETSGLLVMARKKKIFEFLKKQFKDRKVSKTYLTLVHGRLPDEEGVIDSPIGRAVHDRKKMRVTFEGDGKEAISKFKVIKEYEFDGEIFQLLEVEILTGRTHQIRVHMAAIGHPVVGDFKYGSRKINKLFEKSFALKRHFLHSQKLSFEDPLNPKKRLSFSAKEPDDLEAVLKGLEN